jgi:hypothetical protein
MSAYYQEHMQGLQNKINFLNKLEKSGSKSTFDYNNTQYRNTFYNNHENGLVGSRPNRPSDYTSQAQRISSAQSQIRTSNQWLASAGKQLSKPKSSSSKSKKK